MAQSFHPPQRTLMGPGPSDVSPRVLEAMARPTLGHLDPVFVEFMDQVKDLLQFALQTSNPLTMPISGPGSVGMEACFVNLVEPGDTVIVCVNGVFGGRMKENVDRCGATAVVVEDEWGCAVGCSRSISSRLAPAWERWRARYGGSGSWVTAAISRMSCSASELSKPFSRAKERLLKLV